MSAYYEQQYTGSQFLAENGCRTIKDIIRTSNEEKLAKAVVQLYKSNTGSQSWDIIGDGILYLLRNDKILYLVLFSTQEFRAVWQLRLNKKIHYSAEQSHFHTFHAETDMFGINFSDDLEAEIFKNTLNRLLSNSSFFKALSSFISFSFGKIFEKKAKDPFSSETTTISSNAENTSEKIPPLPPIDYPLEPEAWDVCPKCQENNRNGIPLRLFEPYYSQLTNRQADFNPPKRSSTIGKWSPRVNKKPPQPSGYIPEPPPMPPPPPVAHNNPTSAK